MQAGDLIKWSWYLNHGWEQTTFLGVIISSRLVKTDYEKIRVFAAIAGDGTVVEIREDEPSLEVLSASR